MEYCYNSLCGEEDSLYPLALHLSLFVHLYLLFFATWPSAARYAPEHSLLADHVVVGGWNACEETMTSQKEDLFYNSHLPGSSSYFPCLEVASPICRIGPFFSLRWLLLLCHLLSQVSLSGQVTLISLALLSGFIFSLTFTPSDFPNGFLCCLLSPRANIEAS